MRANQKTAVSLNLESENYVALFERLSRLYEDHPEDDEMLFLFAHVAHKLEFYELAISLGRTLVMSSPLSEAKSVLLYEAYLASGDLHGAFCEMDRLTALGHSPEYGRVLAELGENLARLPQHSEYERQLKRYYEIMKEAYSCRSEAPEHVLIDLVPDSPVWDRH
ncbi:MAG: hypothetical protein U0136_13445 [Bdellovibrionota bacterium]